MSHGESGQLGEEPDFDTNSPQADLDKGFLSQYNEDQRRFVRLLCTVELTV